MRRATEAVSPHKEKHRSKESQALTKTLHKKYGKLLRTPSTASWRQNEWYYFSLNYLQKTVLMEYKSLQWYEAFKSSEGGRVEQSSKEFLEDKAEHFDEFLIRKVLDMCCTSHPWIKTPKYTISYFYSMLKTTFIRLSSLTPRSPNKLSTISFITAGLTNIINTPDARVSRINQYFSQYELIRMARIRLGSNLSRLIAWIHGVCCFRRDDKAETLLDLDYLACIVHLDWALFPKHSEAIVRLVQVLMAHRGILNEDYWMTYSWKDSFRDFWCMRGHFE